MDTSLWAPQATPQGGPIGRPHTRVAPQGGHTPGRAQPWTPASDRLAGPHMPPHRAATQGGHTPRPSTAMGARL